MILASLAILLGLPLLIWSAERFIHGASFTAGYFGVSPLFIGMFIIGFGTSAPEIIVSVFAALQGNGGLALGNAYGSNITNITLVAGLTALISPIAVQSGIIRKELPLLLAISFFSVWQLMDLELSHDDAISLLGIFVLLLAWSAWHAKNDKGDKLADEVTESIKGDKTQLKPHVLWLILGLVVLIASSRLLVWGAVEVATYFGVSDVIIGLTIIGIGTSLPELISSLVAVKKGEHEMAIGNVVGSNMFNTLAVVGLAGVIQPVAVDAAFFYRDALLMLGVTVALLIFCLGINKQGRLNRLEGGALLACFVVYNFYLISTNF
ncbi:MAG: calcium/sodium antiporter [Paraglaciecola sp.]|uniref:calcium/sodium antiporter n=1 Tax=Pseudomonadati TaxID=3379134 RepID=UPI00273F2B3E|nr:calcium/sodium antiporter [Paraglaciecola sp.]MDP5031337.1 calcium/sodium antiporter [Paraglaciecola sp.]MDP5131705.1 calcium/sodium antiporter [Paraglaciecola sp.]